MKGACVLVVEDEFLIAAEMQSLLEDSGAEVIGPAYTLATAMALAEAPEISCAILDLRLGRDSISPVADRLCARSIPFVFYSGQPPGEAVLARWPESKLVAKPARPAQILNAVRALLNGG